MIKLAHFLWTSKRGEIRIHNYTSVIYNFYRASNCDNVCVAKIMKNMVHFPHVVG